MSLKIDIQSKNDNVLSFTMSNVNVSIANCIRRTILSDIPTVVFKTVPFSESKATIIENTSIFNNEIIKQRLGCIPIHISDYENFPLTNYELEINVQNESENPIFVTTADFQIKDKLNDKYLSKEELNEIFPPDEYTGDYIDFLRLKPKLSEELMGEKIHLTSEFSIGTSREDGMYNVVSACSYGNTIDKVAQKKSLDLLKQTWKDEGKNAQEIIFEEKNWKLLDGQRIVDKNSFDFIIQTIGVYSNLEIVFLSCTIIINKLNDLKDLINNDKLLITNSDSTIKNSFDIKLENEDYTIGKVLEYYLYEKFYNSGLLTYCGFKKYHPHDTFSIIRVAFNDAVDQSSVKGILIECIDEANLTFNKIKKNFIE
jgi:DNA-directed RNA polymerase subunit L